MTQRIKPDLNQVIGRSSANDEYATPAQEESYSFINLFGASKWALVGANIAVNCGLPTYVSQLLL